MPVLTLHRSITFGCKNIHIYRYIYSPPAARAGPSDAKHSFNRNAKCRIVLGVILHSGRLYRFESCSKPTPHDLSLTCARPSPTSRGGVGALRSLEGHNKNKRQQASPGFRRRCFPQCLGGTPSSNAMRPRGAVPPGYPASTHVLQNDDAKNVWVLQQKLTVNPEQDPRHVPPGHRCPPGPTRGTRECFCFSHLPRLVRSS